MSDEGNRLFVGNLAWATSDQSLHDAFAKVGTVTDAKVIFDRYSGRWRGFGFVTFAESSSASEAVKKMHGTTVDGREIRVDYASSRSGK